MKFSYNWLQDYFQKDLPKPDELRETLSLRAYEVEGIDPVRGRPAEGTTSVASGRLSSNGVEKKADDHILDIDILPNRAHDSFSYRGVAKEVAVLFDLSLKLPEVKYPTIKDKKTEDYSSLEVLDPELAPRCMKRVVLNVKVGDSPDWLKERLSSIGQKSINNIVDITNFVMWETGQPVHAFDRKKVKDGKIIIRRAKKGEKITTLDNIEYELSEEVLVLADGNGPLDIAGTKGGLRSGIDESTTEVILSVCNFNPVSIRRTSRALNLRTDASVRFENGISPYMTEIAMDRLSQLVHELAGGEVLEEILDSYPKDKIRTTAPYKIGVSLSEINKVLGTKLKEGDAEEILNRLSKYAGFQWEKLKPLEKVLEVAKELEGAQYKYGASVTYDAPKYFDCSSFINFVYVEAGIALPRMTVDQFVFGKEISEKDLKPGDLIFSFTPETEEKVERLDTVQKTTYTKSMEFLKGTEVPKLSHNGIYLGDGKVIHASGKWHKEKVVIEKLSESPAFKDIVGYRRVLGSNEERYVVSIPPERLDLRAGSSFLMSGNKEDLIEEVGRIYGYENIKGTLPEKSSGAVRVNKDFYYMSLIKDILVQNGFSEVMTYSFFDKGEVEVANPIASDKAFLRTSLVPGLERAMERGVKYKDLLGIDEVEIFEIGKVFKKKKESNYLGLLSEKSQGTEKALKGLEEKLGVKLESKSSDGVLEINLDELFSKLPEADSYKELANDLSQTKQYKTISPYPFVLRDIAIWVPSDVGDRDARKLIGGIISEIENNPGVAINLFDKYEKEDKTSYAFRLAFQSEEKTLSDNEVNKVMDKVTNEINKKDGWEVR